MNTHCFMFWFLLIGTFLYILGGVISYFKNESEDFIWGGVLLGIGWGLIGWGVLGSSIPQGYKTFDYDERCYKTDNQIIVERGSSVLCSFNDYATYKAVGNYRVVTVRETVSYNVYDFPLKTNYAIVSVSVPMNFEIKK